MLIASHKLLRDNSKAFQVCVKKAANEIYRVNVTHCHFVLSKKKQQKNGVYRRIRRVKDPVILVNLEISRNEAVIVAVT